MLYISLCGSCRNLRMCVFSGISYSMMSMASTPPRGLRLSRINAAHFAATTAKDCRALVMQIWLPLRVWFSYWVYAASKVTSKRPIGACPVSWTRSSKVVVVWCLQVRNSSQISGQMCPQWSFKLEAKFGALSLIWKCVVRKISLFLGVSTDLAFSGCLDRCGVSIDHDWQFYVWNKTSLLVELYCLFFEWGETRFTV